MGAAFYWNARKTAYVARGRRGRCPCQNDSDIGHRKLVGCDAVLHWNDPSRFRQVCPLLFGTDEGWVCSVPASRVRPFWGRVIAWGGGGLVACCLFAVLSVFTFLRTVSDVPVSLAQVGWPPKWPEIRAVQSQRFFRSAIDAFARGRLNEAHLALLSAQQRDPRNYDAALLLAQIAMFQRSVLSSDQQFQRLMREHPAQAARTAVVYHDTLLSLDRMRTLAEFSLVMAKADSARSAIWVRSALLGVRAVGLAEVAELKEEVEPALAALAPHAQQLLRAEFEWRAGDRASALRRLRARFNGPLNPFYTRHQVLRLAELGEAAAAQVLWDFYGPPFGEFEQQLTQFELAMVARDDGAAEGAFRRLLALPLQEQRIDRIAAALIVHPDAGRFQQLSARVRRENLLEAASDGAGLWIAGIVCGVRAEAAYWRSHGRPPLSAFPSITAVDFRSRDLSAENSVCHLVNVLSLPREVILALWARVEPPASASGGAPSARR
ncbi:MAG TPA: hypothetical protein VK477_10475 [Acidobacteriota bacterium]|nr:hypothetical protein [Acidobacteriota bacterium]